MLRAPQLAVLAALLLLVITPASFPAAIAQIPAETSQPRTESALAVTCEVFCSQTKLGSSNARIRWSVSSPALAASGVSLATAKQSLDVSVFYKGLDKGLYVTLPISGRTPQRAVAPQGQSKQAALRAYQFQIVEIEQPKTPQAAESTSGQMGVVIEGLEPGVNYTWRVAIETPSGKVVSAPVTCQASTCPVDLIPPKREPRRKP
jgi:hypothetical protein